MWDNMKEKLLQVENLTKYYGKVDGNNVPAIEDISFSINKGTTFGLVGESGSGKTTVGRCVLQLVDTNEGDVIFDGIKVNSLNERQLKRMRKRMQMIFQDPYSSLDPKMRIGKTIGEGIKAHTKISTKELKEKVLCIMRDCGIDEDFFDRLPRDFSGGQRQRIAIARAIALEPEFIVCDEPVSALDVSIQAQILNLLKDLQEKRNITYMFISHDMSVIKFMCDTIGVMYGGNLLEIADKETIFKNPIHPYTKRLINSIPGNNQLQKNDSNSELINKKDDYYGCQFYYKCKYAEEKCRGSKPTLKKIGDNHLVACYKV